MATGARIRDAAGSFQALNGCPTYLGTIVATTVVDNSTTSTPFAFSGGEQLMFQSDSACYIIPLGAGNANSVTGKMVLIQANEKFFALNPSAGGTGTAGGTAAPLWSVIAVTGTSNVRVFSLG